MKKSYQVIALVLIVLVIDQALKIWVKTHMPLYDNIAYIGQWANLHFVENPGMAFGMELGGNYGKLALSIFRIVAVGFLFYYIRQLLKSNAPAGLILGFGAIFAGAVGNIIDCLFYGMIFSASSYHTVAQIFPVEGGYGSLLHGKVVDMFYFNLFKFPDWVPFLKGHTFFEPVFNVADASITLGVFNILIFQRQHFNQLAIEDKKEVTQNPIVDNETTANEI